MAEGRFVAYYRVSTTKQGASGLGLEAQQEAVRTWLDGGRWKLIAEFTEVESGKARDRPQLAAAIERCRLTGATLVIAKLDRLSRNLSFLAQMMDGDISFVAVDNPHATRFTLHILAAVAEHEAVQISARTKAALAAAKARGVKLGGKRLNQHKVDPALGSAALAQASDDFAKRVGPIAAELRQSGMSLRRIAAELTTRGVRTMRGGKWSAMRVRSVLLRCAPAGEQPAPTAQPAPTPTLPHEIPTRPHHAYRPPGSS